MNLKFTLKKLAILIILIFSSIQSMTQVPQGVNYQAVLRNVSGSIMQNKNVTMKFTIHKATPNGTTVYEETWQTATNGYGLVNLQIGLGSPVVGTFSSVKWGSNNYYLQVSADIGAGYVNLGITQFISVPYALVADTVLHGGGAGDNWGSQTVVSNSTISGGGTSGSPLTLAQQGATTGQILKWNGTSWLPGNDLTGGSGGVTSITAGTGLTGGTITTSGTINAQNTTALWNANQLQGVGVSSSTPTTGQVLQYNGTSWNPANDNDGQTLSLTGTSLSISGGNSVTLPGGITGSGTSNYIPKFNSGTNLITSQIFDDGNYVGIGTTSPSDKLHIEGRFRQDQPYNGTSYSMNITGGANGLGINHNGSSGTLIQATSNTTSNGSNVAVFQSYGKGRVIEIDNFNSSNPNVLVYLYNAASTKWIDAGGNAYLSSGGTNWTNSSDSTMKENIKPVEGKYLLEKIDLLPITEWSYKVDSGKIKHMGPMAQDFYYAFGLGADQKSISTIDPSGIALAAIKELNKQNKEQQLMINELISQLELIKSKMEKLQKIK